MTKPLALSSLDIANLVKEFQDLKGSRLNKFYSDKSNFTLRLNTKDGTKYLNIVLPSLIFLSATTKYSTESASNFSMSVRKHVTNSFLRKIEQLGSERIIRFTFSKGPTEVKLIIELFSRGNLILTDQEGKILTLYSTQSWRSRTIKRGVVYDLPPSSRSYLSKGTALQKLMGDSKLDSIVKFIAVELGLGGNYAEEVCLELEKDSPPGKLKAKEITDGISKLRKKKSPRLYFEDKQPFALSSYKLKHLELDSKSFKTISEMIEDYTSISQVKPSPKQIAVDRQQGIIDQQTEAIISLEKKAKENTRKGEVVYENYTELKELIDEANRLAQKNGWVAAFEFLSMQPKVKSINKKELSFQYKA